MIDSISNLEETGVTTSTDTISQLPITPSTEPLPIWATIFLYIVCAMVVCTCVVCCCGVVHDDGDWDDEP